MKKLLPLCLIPLLIGCDRNLKEESIDGLPETESISLLKIIDYTKKSSLDFGCNKDIITRASTDIIDIRMAGTTTLPL